MAAGLHDHNPYPRLPVWRSDKGVSGVNRRRYSGLTRVGNYMWLGQWRGVPA